MRNKLILGLLLVFKLGFSQSNDSIQTDQFYKRLINAFRENSINKEKIDWPEFEKRVLEKALVSKDSAIILALDLNGNPHTYYKSSGHKLYSTKPAKSDKVYNLKDCAEINFKNEFHDIGYIEVSAFQTSFNNSNEQKKKSENYINQILDSIKTLDNHKLKGWIIDLRKNSGGNMWPMLVALAPFYSDGTLGYFISGQKETRWSKINNRIYLDSENQTIKYTSTDINYDLKNKNLKIVVLISNKTSSSGEAIAISTKAIANAKLFGEKTYGFATANRPVKIAEGEFLIITSAVDADINKTEYWDGILPDFQYGCEEIISGLKKWFDE